MKKYANIFALHNEIINTSKSECQALFVRCTNGEFIINKTMKEVVKEKVIFLSGKSHIFSGGNLDTTPQNIIH